MGKSVCLGFLMGEEYESGGREMRSEDAGRMVAVKGVHRSVQVRFMPNPRPTRQNRVEEV